MDADQQPIRPRRLRVEMGRRLPRGGRSPTRGRSRSRPAPPRTAFVLSGGGNQGVAQVGMLRAVLERGIVPDVVIGTSAGALNGAAVAYSPNLTGVAQLDAVWTALTATDVFPGGKFQPGVERRAPRDAPVRERPASTRSSTAPPRPAASPTSRYRCA